MTTSLEKTQGAEVETQGRASQAIHDYRAALWVRKWSILGVTGLVLASVLFFSFRQTPIYESRTRVLLEPRGLPEEQTASAEGPNMETERQLASSLSIARVVVDRLNLRLDPGAVLEHLSVSAPVETEILEFTYAHPRPSEARRRSQVFAEAYLDYRREQALDKYLASSQSVQKRLGVLNQQLQRVHRSIARERDGANKAALQTQANSLVTQIAVLQQKLSDVSPGRDIEVGEIVEPALAPSSPARPNHPLNGGLGLMIGLVLGLGVALLREYLDDRVRGRADLETYSRSPVLAVVPNVPSWRKPEDAFVIALRDPTSAAAEAYRQLRTNVMFSALQRGAKKLLVTSAQGQEGKTSTLANLGVVLARAGTRVILVSADLRKPRLHEFFDGVDNSVGVTSVLAGRASLPQALQQVGVENLRLLPSGPIPGNPAELLASEGMWRILADLHRSADFVLIDSPPLLPVADATVLVPFVDAVLFLADGRHATRRAIADARTQLDKVDAYCMGAVLNNVDPSKVRTYPSYYPYREERSQMAGRGTA